MHGLRWSKQARKACVFLCARSAPGLSSVVERAPPPAQLLLGASNMRFLPLLVALAACGGATPHRDPTSRGLRATQHLERAREHDQRAAALAGAPDLRSNQDADGQVALARWSRSWDTAAEHRYHADVHRGRAAALQAGYDEACRDLPAEVIKVSPLQRFGAGGTPTATGVLVVLAAYPGTPDALMAELRCHRAWMMLGPAGMDDCPLDLPGLRVDARGEAGEITLELAVDDALVPELQRRTALDLESAKRRAPR